MATVQREAIFAALFARMEAQMTGIVTFTRIWRGWSQISKLQQPAAVLLKGDEFVEQRRGLPPLYRLEAFIIVCATVEQDPSVPPAVLLNTWCDELEALLQRTALETAHAGATFANNPDMMYGTTLGGLCSSVRFSGDISVVEGEVGQQSIIVAPLLITAAAAT